MCSIHLSTEEDVIKGKAKVQSRMQQVIILGFFWLRLMDTVKRGTAMGTVDHAFLSCTAYTFGKQSKCSLNRTTSALFSPMCVWWLHYGTCWVTFFHGIPTDIENNRKCCVNGPYFGCFVCSSCSHYNILLNFHSSKPVATRLQFELFTWAIRSSKL